MTLFPQLVRFRMIPPSCGNCIYSYFRPDDPEEEERCKVVGRGKEVKINPLAKRWIDKTGCGGMCEYHEAPEAIKKQMAYNFI